jgi:mono/diheme cytochrome c family protein
MRLHTNEVPVAARPLAPVFTTVVVTVILHALVVGCGGSQKSSSSSPGDGSSAQAPATTASATGGGEEAASGDLGAKVYAQRCALCHGPQGKGDGPAAAGLNPKPRNHTDGAYMNSRTDDELLEVIRNGKGGMPAWGKILSEAETQAVLKHVRTLAK